jgi:hypothetical protein
MSVASLPWVRPEGRERDGRPRLALLPATLLVFAIYKPWAVGIAHPGELLWSYAFDGCVWIALWLVGELIARSASRRSEHLANAVFYPALYASGALVFAHAFYYEAAVERRLTALDVTFAGIAEFFLETLPLPGYVAMALMLIGMHLFAWFASLFVRRPTLYQSLVCAVPVIVATASGAVFAQRTPSVLYDTGQDLWELATLPRIVPSSFAGEPERLRELDKSQLPTELPAPRFDKVIVLVMETMTVEKLTREIVPLDRRSFFLAESSHFHGSSRYFTNNQDSRTGMLNMLMSRVIPYEAYNDRGVAGYERLSTQTSLTDRFKALGYSTAFVVSQLELEAVVSDLAWDERLHLSTEEIAQAKPKHLCFEPDDWENGCEDLVVLPKVVKFVAEHERAFVYQEFNWGHNDVYNDVSGKSNLAYYSSYVDALLSALRERGLSERTLIVLTSDHGFRDRSVQDQPSMVHIPLLFYAPRFAAHDDDRLLSHVDFKDLLFSELTGQTDLVTPNELVLIVGPTGSKLVTAISAHGDFTLMRRRGSLRRLSMRRSRNAQALTPDELFHLFERYRTVFDDKLSRAL